MWIHCYVPSKSDCYSISDRKAFFACQNKFYWAIYSREQATRLSMFNHRTWLPVSLNEQVVGVRSSVPVPLPVSLPAKKSNM